MATAERLQRLLNEHAIRCRELPHPRSASSGESAVAAHIPEDHIAKGVVLKGEEDFLLVVLPADRWVDLRAVTEELGRPYVLAFEEDVDRLFADCAPGAVPPAGAAYGLETLLDGALTTLAEVCFESGDHERLLALDQAEFQRLMAGARHGRFAADG